METNRAPSPYRMFALLALHALYASIASFAASASLGCSGAGSDDRTPGGTSGSMAGAGGASGAAGSTGAAGSSGAAGTQPGRLDAGLRDASALDSGRADAATDAAAPSDAGGDAAVDASTPDDAGPTGMTYVYLSGYGANIHVFELDLATGAMRARGTADGGESPSFLAIAPDRRTLYAINEASPNSEVVAFSIDPASGALAEINRANSGGEGAPHLAVHPSGKWIAVAHYGSGHTTVLPVLASGGVGAVVATEQGPNDDCGRAHQAVFDRSGAHLFVPCLQSNYVQQFVFDATDGSLAYNSPATAPVAGGPRHMALHPSERSAYVLSELASTITSFDYDAASGKLSNPQVIDSHQSTAGASAHIAVHPSGRFLYASNRDENSIAAFALDAGGRPTAANASFVTEMIDTPRNFAIDPSGTFLISANQRGPQNALVFRIDAQNGMLTRVQVVPVGDSPTFVGFAILP
jgi:6-phosphogluconolactonase